MSTEPTKVQTVEGPLATDLRTIRNGEQAGDAIDKLLRRTEPLDDAALAKIERDGLWEAAEDRRIASRMREKHNADRINRRADVTERLVAALRAERAKTQRVRELHQQMPMYETCPAWHGCAEDACRETLDGGYVHIDQRDGEACSHCCESDGEPVGWPCETVAALEGGTDEK